MLVQAAIAPLLLHLLAHLLSSNVVGRPAKRYLLSLGRLLLGKKALVPASIPFLSGETKAKILLTGATGYVGGSVLHTLLSHPSLTDMVTSSNPITLPVRGSPDRLAKLAEAYGPRVKPVQITSLDDINTITRLASEHDVVINAGSGFHPPRPKPSSAASPCARLRRRRPCG